VKVLSIPSAEQNYLVFNTGNSANPLLNNPAFWEAARWLVDYDGITKNLLKGQYFVHQSFLPVGLPGRWKTIRLNLTRQKQRDPRQSGH
jgi:peptide/nickel transport system substrate-binding protein